MHMKFLALNANFSSPRADPVGSRRPAHASVKEGHPSKSGNLPILAGRANRHRRAAYHNKHWSQAF